MSKIIIDENYQLNIMISKHFSLREMIRSKTAQRLKIENEPNKIQFENIVALVENVLQPIRTRFKKPVNVNSGFRCKKLNRHIPGSSLKSQHQKGQAADIEIYGKSNYDLAVYIKNQINFDQLILEYHTPEEPNSGWVHVSYVIDPIKNRKQVLTKFSGDRKYYKGLLLEKI